jgi:uncharacterized phage-associated protein
MKLQKLIYYLKVWAIIDNKPELINVNFEKWNYGPVNRELWIHYKKYESKPITENHYVIDYNVSEEEDKTLNFILENYLPIQAISLSLMTHKEEPWKNTDNNQIISNGSIYNYYSKQIFAKNFPIDFENKKYYPVISNESYAYYADMTEKEMNSLLSYPSYIQYKEIKEKTQKGFNNLLKRSLKLSSFKIS